MGIKKEEAAIVFVDEEFTIYCNTTKANKDKMDKKLNEILSEIRIETINVKNSIVVREQ